MRVKSLSSVSLTMCVFDDEARWVHVDVTRSGTAPRTVFQGKAITQISDDELDHALVVLDQTAQTWLNHFRRAQRQLW